MPFLTFMVGWRDEKIGELAEEYKFYSVMALGKVLAGVLDEALPYFAEKVVVVPLPTIEKHIRERGLDHTFTIAKELAKMRGWEVERVLERAENTVQVGANAKEREKQARKAYRVKKSFSANPEKVYLLFDDIWTTGASMRAATGLIEKAGAKKIIVSVLAVNRVGKKPRVRQQG